jgi:BirA family transcriptional regulator, biotin operon repressor / biotin---[acetyl-CoA-carboxylase] ligase
MSITDWSSKWAQNENLDIYVKDKTKSTNDWAKDDPSEKAFYLFLARYQTQGKGRHKRIWESSKPDSALLSTWSFRMPSSPQPIASPLIGLFLYQSVKTVWPDLSWHLKAPNDLYIKDKKLAGILLETVSWAGETRLLVGLGFNVSDHPESVKNSGHLDEFLENPVNEKSWISFLNLFYSQIETNLRSLTDNELKNDHRESLISALNQNPNLDENYLDVLLDGSLKTTSKIISWKDL